MAEHTRLPRHHSRKSVYVSDTNHTCIAQMLREQEVNEANAAFIVKAVNNHEALVTALSDLLDCADTECVSGSSHEPIERARDLLDVLIAPRHT